MIKLGILAMGVSITCLAQSNEIKAPEKSELKGSVLTAGKSFMDPGPDYTPDTNLLITISGKSAEQIFRSLKVKEVKSKFCPWSDDGDCFPRVEKKTKGIYCLSSPPTHGATCTINYDLVNQDFIDPNSFSTGGDI